MIRLVQYDSSDDSESEFMQNTTCYLKPAENFQELEETVFDDIQKEERKLKQKEDNKDKSNKNIVKISIPTVAHFEDEDDKSFVKTIKQSKGCNLLDILPPPKKCPLTPISFLPNILATKKNLYKHKMITEEVIDVNDDYDLIQTFNDDIWQKVCNKRSKVSKYTPVMYNTKANNSIDLVPSLEKNHMLTNYDFKKLVTKSKKPKSMKYIDINEEDILPAKEMWMIKSLTNPLYAPKQEITDSANSNCKKKHHITYLVQQAKANEEDLKTQWAATKYTRKQTQAKYGFL